MIRISNHGLDKGTLTWDGDSCQLHVFMQPQFGPARSVVIEIHNIANNLHISAPPHPSNCMCVTQMSDVPS